MKYVSVFISKLGINYAVSIKWIDETWQNNLLLLVPNCYEVVAMVATSRRYGCAIVMSYTEITKAVSQKMLTINLCISVTWLFTCAFHISHDDVINWKHFPRYWPFVRGIHRSPVNSPYKGQWHGILMFSLIYAWIKNREAGDLRRHRAHCDVIVMLSTHPWNHWYAPGAYVINYMNKHRYMFLNHQNSTNEWILLLWK